MQFFFCETCGRRVTEKDIEAGNARNKKLNGVYCQTCAAGVLTMETLPISDEEARTLLGKKQATPAPKTASTPKKVSDHATHAQAPRQARPAEPVKSPPVEDGSDKSRRGLKRAILAVLVVLMVVGLIWSTSGRPKSPQIEAAAQKAKEVSSLPVGTEGKSAPVAKTAETPIAPLKTAQSPKAVERTSGAKAGLISERQFLADEVDAVWKTIGNAPSKILDGAWRVDTTSVQERGAALTTKESHPLNRRYRLTVKGGTKGSTPNWKDMGQAAQIGVYRSRNAQLQPDAYPMVPFVGVSFHNGIASVTRANVEKLWAVVTLAQGASLTDQFEAVLEIDRNTVSITANGKLLYEGPHGVPDFEAGNFLLRGCNWKDPKGQEVYYSNIKLEIIPYP